MHVVRLAHKISHRQLQAMRVKPHRLCLGHQPQTRAEILKDIRRVRNDGLACLQQRRRVGRVLVCRVLQHPRDGRPAAAFGLGQPRHIDVIRFAFFQRQESLAAAVAADQVRRLRKQAVAAAVANTVINVFIFLYLI